MNSKELLDLFQIQYRLCMLARIGVKLRYELGA